METHPSHLVLPINELISETMFEIQSKEAKIEQRAMVHDEMSGRLQAAITKLDEDAEKARSLVVGYFK
jgi:hypothetical protein